MSLSALAARSVQGVGRTCAMGPLPSLVLVALVAHGLVLPDVVEDVAEAVDFEPAAGASVSLQGKSIRVNYTVTGHLALHPRLPTALAENPVWLPTAEQLQGLSTKEAEQRLGFFVSAHILVWMGFCLVGTLIMTRCGERFLDRDAHARLEEEGTSLDGLDIFGAFLVTYLACLVAVGLSMQLGRLSKTTGLDYEVYLALFTAQGMNLLWQARQATRRVGRAERFPIDTFALGTVAGMLPFLSDTFDTLKDAGTGIIGV